MLGRDKRTGHCFDAVVCLKQSADTPNIDKCWRWYFWRRCTHLVKPCDFRPVCPQPTSWSTPCACRSPWFTRCRASGGLAARCASCCLTPRAWLSTSPRWRSMSSPWTATGRSSFSGFWLLTQCRCFSRESQPTRISSGYIFCSVECWLN